MKSHAQVPTALAKEEEGILRVYFASRPDPKISLTGFVDLDIKDLKKIVYVHPNPILNLGEAGSFDEHGVMPSSVINKEGVIYLYYSGWARGYSLPYSNYTGLALSEDGGKTFKKYSKGPIVDRTPFEIYSATSPFVTIIDKTWYMFYCSGTNWLKINGRYEHTYDIKYAKSNDGITWERTNNAIVQQKNNSEAITRPTVFEIDGIYHMLFCYRGSKNFRNGRSGYRIGYAYSTDILNWKRCDRDSGICLSKSGWDSRMIAYPCAVNTEGQYYLFYNGNGFGATGFGYATLYD